MIEYPPLTSLPVTPLDGNVYWLANLLNSAHESNTKCDKHIIKQCLVRHPTSLCTDFQVVSCKLLFHVNCHSFMSRMLLLQTHRH